VRPRLPALAFGAAALWLALAFLPPRTKGFDLAAFGRLPVLHEGRLKPIDTVVRSSLLFLRGKQSVYDGRRRLGPVEWALEAAARPEKADELPAFVIDDPDVLGLLDLERKGRYYSFRQLEPSLAAVAAQAERAESIEPARRSRYQAAVLALHARLDLYRRLRNTLQPAGAADFPAEIALLEKDAPAVARALHEHRHGGRDAKTLQRIMPILERSQLLAEDALFQALPPRVDGGWASVGEGLLQAFESGRTHPGALAYARILKAYRDGDAPRFNEVVARWRAELPAQAAAAAAREAAVSRYDPFGKGMALYLAALLLACASWLFWPEALSRAGTALMGAAFAAHTGGLLARMLVHGRPPVTNLYSSAVFVGWTAVLLGLLFDLRPRKAAGADGARGAATAVASAVGFATLIIAHHLSAGGDTMEMMSAVLDSNFWLTTHVVTITMGYGGCFLAGALAHVFILRGALGFPLDEESGRALERMTYGALCFALFFSFVGTVLGGIWADQSWGRFWGWDPKENGALLIVLWISLILHARATRTAGARGVMALAVLGSALTAFSWFGVNMLGVGLHSYGFMDKAFAWLAAFILSQLAVAALALRLPPSPSRP